MISVEAAGNYIDNSAISLPLWLNIISDKTPKSFRGHFDQWALAVRGNLGGKAPHQTEKLTACDTEQE